MEIVPLRHFFPLKVVPLIEILLYINLMLRDSCQMNKGPVIRANLLKRDVKITAKHSRYRIFPLNISGERNCPAETQIPLKETRLYLSGIKPTICKPLLNT
jgi:hypothetical protein